MHYHQFSRHMHGHTRLHYSRKIGIATLDDEHMVILAKHMLGEEGEKTCESQPYISRRLPEGGGSKKTADYKQITCAMSSQATLL